VLVATRQGIDEVDDVEDDGVSDWFDPADQVRPVGLGLLVLALEGTREGKRQEVLAKVGLVSGSNRLFAWRFDDPLQAGTKRETSDTESSTK